MSIEDSIREVFKKKKMTEASVYNSDTQPNLYELYNFLRKSGYNLIEVVAHKGKSPEIVLEPSKPGHLHPEITHDLSDNHFYVKVVEYGLLIDSDVEEIIKGYENALSVVRHLESIHLDKLEIDEEE